MPVVATHKYGCNPNMKIVIRILLSSYVEDYWLTSITFYNKLPLFHSSLASCSSVANKLAHHFELFETFYKKLTTIMQKYNLGSLQCNCYTS
jgi:hypothetical protein